MEPSSVPALRFSLSVFIFSWKPSDQGDVGGSPERIFPDKENRRACPELQQCENAVTAERDIVFIQIINKGLIYRIPIPAQNERGVRMIFWNEELLRMLQKFCFELWNLSIYKEVRPLEFWMHETLLFYRFWQNVEVESRKKEGNLFTWWKMRDAEIKEKQNKSDVEKFLLQERKGSNFYCSNITKPDIAACSFWDSGL